MLSFQILFLIPTMHIIGILLLDRIFTQISIPIPISIPIQIIFYCMLFRQIFCRQILQTIFCKQSLVYKSRPIMELGTSIALFLGLAVALMILFCLVTKYFQYKMNQRSQQAGQTFSQVDQITQESNQELQGQYDDFLQKRKSQLQQKGPTKKKREEAYMFQTSLMQSPMKDSTDPIYGVSMLRRRLDGQVLPMKEQTGRSLHSAKSFRPQRMHTGRSSNESDRGLIIKPEEVLVVHDFVSKLISYNQHGLDIMEINVISLTKVKGVVTEKKTLNSTKISPADVGFNDHLQVLGFQHKQYSCCQTKARVEIPFMLQGQQYKLSSLKVSESKEQIDFSEYYKLKDKAENSLS